MGTDARVDSLTAVPTLCQALRDRLPPEVVVVSPDVGRARVASRYAQCLGAPVIVLHKERVSSTETEETDVWESSRPEHA
jgi:ribose-phosphate pyrophosphokinase